MFKEGVVEQNMFSIALWDKGGKLVFGGLPDDVSYEKPLVTVPIVPESENWIDGSLAYGPYQVNATFSYVGASKVSPLPSTKRNTPANHTRLETKTLQNPHGHRIRPQ